ncbi:hypothetical protein CMUS01_12674 [Colletotrichum musicola]|uniref:Uncharacterized protein n=1 Tax=Colletotrichum musicola TaxID=2175873 RepID=A0A8H6JKE5_9PEZI|nr:hypothetical protein CMUS01_12674 [Colletotrichum musicola]
MVVNPRSTAHPIPSRRTPSHAVRDELSLRAAVYLLRPNLLPSIECSQPKPTAVCPPSLAVSIHCPRRNSNGLTQSQSFRWSRQVLGCWRPRKMVWTEPSDVGGSTRPLSSWPLAHTRFPLLLFPLARTKPPDKFSPGRTLLATNLLGTGHLGLDLVSQWSPEPSKPRSETATIGATTTCYAKKFQFPPMPSPLLHPALSPPNPNHSLGAAAARPSSRHPRAALQPEGPSTFSAIWG